MTLKQYLGLMAVATAAALFGWLYVLVNIDPFHAGFIGLFSFYITFFLTIVGMLTILNSLYRLGIRKREMVSQEIAISFRHGLLLGAVCSFLLWVSTQDFLYWWVILSSFFLIGLIEYTFLARHARRSAS